MDLQKRIHELFDYSIITGEFYHKTKTSRRNIGDIAGSYYGNRKYIRFDGSRHRASRLAWIYVNGRLPNGVIDHINGDSMFDGYINLRDITQIENCKNSRRSCNNKSGITGVCKEKFTGKWLSKIMVDRKNITIGRFDDFFEACCARKSAENNYGFHKNHGRI